MSQGFKERLAQLRAEQEEKKGVPEADQKAAEKAKERQKEREEKIYEGLERFATSQLRPTLELVNEVYLCGGGKIALERAPSLSFELGLDWDKQSFFDGAGICHGVSGKRLTMRLTNHQTVEIKAGEKNSLPVAVLNHEDETFQQELEEEIVFILASPNSCSWRSS